MEHASNPGLEEREETTIRMYDQTAEKWAKSSDGVGTRGEPLWERAHDTLSRLAANVPGEGKKSLLEVGFGTGRDAKRLSEVYDYVGIEPSKGFIDVARRATNGLVSPEAFRQMSVYELMSTFSKESFDLFWACASLLHCRKYRMPEALVNIRYVLREGGVGFISLKEGDGEHEDKFDGIPRWFMYWRHGEFTNELEHAGFKTLEFYRKPARMDFLCYFVQKV